MSRINSTSSIELREISSVGQSEIDCATPYSHNPWTSESGIASWMFQIECVPGQVFVVQGDETYDVEAPAVEDRVAFALRHICHLLIERLDKTGLEEACQSLGEFIEYYRPKEASNTLRPVSEPFRNITGTNTQAYRRVLPSVYDRPFQISEE